MSAEELYNCRDHGHPILHSTTIELKLRHEQAAYLLGLHPTSSRDSVQVTDSDNTDNYGNRLWYNAIDKSGDRKSSKSIVDKCFFTIL